MEIPESFQNEQELDEFMSTPYPETVEMMKWLNGDVMILGAGGKMGHSLAATLVRAGREAGVEREIVGVDLFDDARVEEKIHNMGVKTIACDLLSPSEVNDLPKIKNIFFMVGRKFGETGSEYLTWIINVVLPGFVGRSLRDLRVVAFSTGCVYSLTSPESGGSKETDPPRPIGEYANTCLGRERVFEHYSRKNDNKVLLFRLNYSVDLRYGVLVDIAHQVFNEKPVDLKVGSINCIWQGDAVNRAILSLEKVEKPPSILNVTGKEILSVREIAEKFGEIFGKKVQFTGEDSGKAYLSDASKSIELFGEPKIGPDKMITWVADWMHRGGSLLGKPTHFQVTDGQFLD